MARSRITGTAAARDAIARLVADRGPVIFVQSAGCCAGSTPMCFPEGEFIVGDSDVVLGEIDGCQFVIDRRLDRAWGYDEFVLDVVEGDPEGFSLPASRGHHFVTRTGNCVPDARRPIQSKRGSL